MGSASRQLTVLTTKGVIAVKTYKRAADGKVKVEGYGRAKRFTAKTIDVDDRGRWLKELRRKRDSFVVLGQPVAQWKAGESRRRLSAARDGDEATLEDVARSWMPIDVDQVGFEPFAAIDDGETFAGELLDWLGLRGVRCVWHLTNSHGFFDRYRARLWVELETPMTAAQMKEYASDRWDDLTVEVDGKRKRAVDTSVYQPQQPIYTGDPVLEGVDDPAPRRVGFIDGGALKARVAKGKGKGKGKKKGAPEDDNVARLEEAGLYIGRLRPGQHMVQCPWEDEHTGPARDDDTFYFEPHFNGHDAPAFKCHHDSCRDRHWSDVLEELGGVAGPGEGRDDDAGELEPNWVYIHRLKMFWDARDGALIERESYDTTHGGRNKRGTPTDRFLAMARSAKADAAEFLPGRERFVQRGRVRVLNMYSDQRVPPAKGVDVTPWIEHLEWAIPDKVDREHVMDWMAWCYQRPGDKITWAPILYSRSFGVGKTTIFSCLAECLGRAHVSEPTQAELEDKFNDWCFGKLLVKIEELMSGDKYHVAEKLKPVVSNPTLSIRRMHQTGFTVANTANVCASTNHMQALPIEKGDRRWMLVQCVEATKEQRRPRMKAFHRWLDRTGYGGIAAWLSERDVSRFSPRGEAPETRLKDFVADASKTDFERAVELCDVFDEQDVISSHAIADYLAQNECKLSVQRIGLIALRRDWATLPGRRGRVTIGGRKVTLWTRKGGLVKLQAFIAKSPGERERLHQTLLAKMSFDDVQDDKDDLAR